MNAIAIDGFSSTGKSSVAKVLAQRLGYLYVDTGAMYRAVALHALRNGWVGPDGSLEAAGSTDALRAGVGALDIRWRWEASGHQHTLLNGEDVEAQIRTMEISQIVSKVSAVPQVRRALVAQQQKLGTDSPGVVMDGRDIGTVVFPEAKLKIFMTARPDVRAARRFAEMEAKGYKFAFNGNKMVGITPPGANSSIVGDAMGEHLSDYMEISHPLRTSRWKTKKMEAFYNLKI